MKHCWPAFYSLIFTVNLFACIDPPTPIQPTESTFENEHLMVSSRDIWIGRYKIYFDEREGGWCYWENENSICGKKNLVVQGENRKIVGAVIFNSIAKTVTLYQVKAAKGGKKGGIDKDASHIVFTEKSSDEYERIEAKAMGIDGLLGSVTAERSINQKGIVPLAAGSASSPREKVNLRDSNVKVSGCSGNITPGEESEPRVKPKSRFVVGSEFHR